MRTFPPTERPVSARDRPRDRPGARAPAAQQGRVHRDHVRQRAAEHARLVQQVLRERSEPDGGPV